eukprot:193603-Lingulodinium_polyedra.AAC.1
MRNLQTRLFPDLPMRLDHCNTSRAWPSALPKGWRCNLGSESKQCRQYSSRAPAGPRMYSTKLS